ncbi:MAG: ATP synthase F1 subunit delta [Zetaproteobacteria bacterium CG12_big_fil_rev_8_21_14_0_65_55_1124]|nr:MAG: ATP synthase F1 subunit delta [Zetaproteobacteria bacterium CG1_02_55_237]PIS18848.1 MAG: ATP synthase F1 subunit delta [Zetaproteobacteria bacterium CG08_land_8_20_14_0_20_55_17]PIW42765.1 MAG: ATP synthase F1 subunit delta [Zetaproteobacteria bacterium CG12_big_fil_rev_8_21_14_0_65_55_1124]PIY51793.1 MAG: ATP synthase F1 subunit delta [Zetaproteobacteria bacterium CG_4_10_14_0_8_um_filter_55_43]PIZ40045.1 MAG: ATP synthase F1 subunit delta [Zetaproteobacteria bacterium CG_4_10_14_0_2_
MSTTSISRRYARALFELQQEGVSIADALSAAAAVAGVAEVASVLDQPQIPASVKTAIIDKVAKGLGKEVSRLVLMLCERGKASLLPEINALFEEMMRHASSQIEAEVVAATALNKAAQDSIAAALTKAVGRKVVIKTSQDKDILGGLVVRLGDRQLDYSLRTRLEGLKRAMVS